jgi:hypothetical protein
MDERGAIGRSGTARGHGWRVGVAPTRWCLDSLPDHAHDPHMSDDKKPDPIEDVRKGLGLLFRAARTTIEKLPTRDFEEAVTTGVREVGRAVENVGRTIERDVFGVKNATPPADAAPPRADAAKEDVEKPEDPKPPEGGPRV